jgi:O-antigen ligase
LERWLVGLLSAQLIFLPWALGGMHLWARLVGFGLATAAFFIALRPRTYDDPDFAPEPYRLVMWPKLLRFPIFWLGLVFFAYVGLQMLNPAWRYLQNAQGGWWVEPMQAVSWLPHGIADTPVTRQLAPPWHSALPIATAFLSVCAAWVGLTRRRAIVLLLTTLAINASLIALFAVIQRVAGNGQIFWFWNPPANYFIGPFIYKNHGGAYFNLLIAVSAALAAHHFVRTEQQMLKSAPSGVFLFLAMTLGAVVLISYCRAATFLLIGYVTFLGTAVLLHQFLRRSASHNRVIGISLLLLLGAFALVGVRSLKLGSAWDRANALFESDYHASVEARQIVSSASFELAGRAPWLGQGLGSFRYLFPQEQLKHPELLSEGKYIGTFWDHAHNDYAETAVELGVLGVLPLLAILGTFLTTLVRQSFWRHPPIWVLLLGLFLTAAHSWVDFQAQNPAVLITWCVLWPCLIRWTELEREMPREGTQP